MRSVYELKKNYYIIIFNAFLKRWHNTHIFLKCKYHYDDSNFYGLGAIRWILVNFKIYKAVPGS